MRNFTWIFAVLLIAGTAEARQSPAPGKAPDEQPKWDFGVTAGLLEVRPEDYNAAYGDDWFFEGRYAASIGRYWTRNLKTEIEFAASGEGKRYVQEYALLPGAPQPYPYSYEQFHRIQHTTARVVYQFLDNAWAHPWVSAGVIYEADRQHQFLPARYQYNNDPRTGPPLMLARETRTAATTDHRVGGSIGFGSKFYVSTDSYVNTGLIVSRTKPTTTISFIAGFGIDF